MKVLELEKQPEEEEGTLRWAAATSGDKGKWCYCQATWKMLGP